ncbi:Kinesin-like calmodulin-binding protein [Abeliophyllum distichum]|uniref:Kinesin-like calmodulin-binding protein n=1 Tax=Abeliophyllum distichum TaxID=126358 RepID=A0ABD1V1L8_9LAMI
MEKSGKFVAVDPCPGALLVTLGDVAVEILQCEASSSMQGSRNKDVDCYVSLNNQVLRKTQDELKARSAELHAVEEPKRKLTSEKASLQERITRLERKNADEIAVIEGSFEKERKALKLRILELEMKLEEVTKDLAVVQSALGAKDTELSPLQNNLRELEDLRETKEDIDRKNEQTAAILELKTLRCKVLNWLRWRHFTRKSKF